MLTVELTQFLNWQQKRSKNIPVFENSATRNSWRLLTPVYWLLELEVYQPMRTQISIKHMQHHM